MGGGEDVCQGNLNQHIRPIVLALRWIIALFTNGGWGGGRLRYDRLSNIDRLLNGGGGCVTIARGTYIQMGGERSRYDRSLNVFTNGERGGEGLRYDRPWNIYTNGGRGVALR